MPTTTKYQITKQIEALNKHDPQAFTAFYATDATIVDPQYPEPLKGRDQIRKDITDFVKAFPDLRFTLDSVVERDDTVAFEGICKGTHQGPMLGPSGEIPATNKPVSLRFASFLKVNEQGLITAERRYYDVAGMMQQLGLSQQ